MEDFISLSMLNDFIFCPYSIYLRNVYMEADEGLYHAFPQTRGRIAHESVDERKFSTKKSDIVSLPVISTRLRVFGKIDIYKEDRKLLVERKYQLKQIFRGQLYQLWAQYECMLEMGYDVRHLAFYEISTNKMIAVNLPTADERSELEMFINKFREFSPEQSVAVNPNKCTHCIYCNLCDKTDSDNVYS